MMHDFKNKVFALTGAASGIGLATAQHLAVCGARISICDVSGDALAEAVAQIKACSAAKSEDMIMYRILDLRNRSQVEEWIRATVQQFGNLDGVANVAGVNQKLQPIHELDDDNWDRIIGINLTSVMYCLRAQIPYIKDGGSIVNVASIAGRIAFGFDSAYVASKHGVIGLSKSAAKELGVRRVRVNCIAPGMTDTPMLRATTFADTQGNSNVAIRRIGTPVECAELIAWLLCDSSAYITGTVNYIDGGWTCPS